MSLLSACDRDDWERARQLIRDGVDVNTSGGYGQTALMYAARYGKDQVLVELITRGAHVNVRNNSQQTALHYASWNGHWNVVKTLIQAGANINVQDECGLTPLMDAARSGKDQVLVELIRGGAGVNVTSNSRDWMDGTAAGSTALHFAAVHNRVKCGVLLVEAGADMTARNKASKSPIDLASGDFRQTIRQAQSFSTKRIVTVIGNAEHGKSTLIAALQSEGKNVFTRIANRFAQVEDISQRTAGIEAVQFSSRKYGQTLFYDFAGQANYHGPHQSFLEGILSKPGVSVTLLLLVKATEEKDIITKQVTRWLQPLALMSAPSTPRVILIGSFVDKVKSREEATEKLLRCTQSVQEELPFKIQGPCLLDCRKPESEGINQICAFFKEVPPLQLNSETLSYSLSWIMKEMQNAFSIPAVTLQTFQSWLLDVAKLVLRNFPSPKQMCQDLTAIGHALFLPNKQDPSQSWLILDLQAILHTVYGTLFSGSQGKVNQFGLLHCSQLAELFPTLDLTMIEEILIRLDFCVQVNARMLREDLLKLMSSTEEEGWLYFPALVSAQPPKLFPGDPDPQYLQWVCWQLRMEEKYLISAHLLQCILRLAANHVFTHELPSVREHCCTVWVNGLSWMSTKGVDVAVQISDSSVVQVVGRSEEGPEKLHRYVSSIVQDVIKTTAQLSPKLKATSYIVHPYTPAMWEGREAPPPDSLYPVASIIRCINDEDSHILSRQHAGCLPHRTSLTELFGGWSPSLSLVQDMDFKSQPQIAPLSSDLPSVPSSSSSRNGATTADKVPSTETEALTATQQDGHTHFTIDSTPTLQATRKFIVREVAADWSTIAIYLGFESSVIRMARTDHPQQCELACADIFERWLSWEPGTGERERTWRSVLSAVEDAGHKAFTRQLKTEWFLPQ